VTPLNQGSKQSKNSVKEYTSGIGGSGGSLIGDFQKNQNWRLYKQNQRTPQKKTDNKLP
jgi:hypothetical protein